MIIRSDFEVDFEVTLKYSLNNFKESGLFYVFGRDYR